MKNKKLKLKDLAVKSFVTDMKPETEETIKGGVSTIPSYVRNSIIQGCPTSPGLCTPDDTFITGCNACGPSDFICPIDFWD